MDAGASDLGTERSARALTPVDLALEELGTAYDHLLKLVEDGGLGDCDDAGFVGFVQGFESLRNRLSVLDHRVIGDGDSRGLASAVGEPSMRRVLVKVLRVSSAEASRRVSAAEACGERVSMLGEVLTPARPCLASVQREGVVSPEQVNIIERALGKVDRRGFDPADITAAEELLTGCAVTFGPKELRLLAERTVDAIDPDGTLPDDELQQDRRHFSMRRCPDGIYAGEFRLSGSLGAKLSSILQPLSRPRLDSVTGADGITRPVLDERTFGQRTHDGLEDVCDRILGAGDVPGTGGTPVTVIITVLLEDLLARLGYGTTSDGVLIPVPKVLELARAADIIPVVMNRAGAVLSLGRTRRLASPAQTLALVARDHGCSFPACDRAPAWCEKHHIIEWVDGGLTDLDNLTLLCRLHHHNFASKGWTCEINSDGLPEWRPPRWLDRERKPLINTRITAHLEAWRHQRQQKSPRDASTVTGDTFTL